MTVLTMRQAIVNGLREQLGDAVRTVEAYEGDLTPEELHRVFHSTPAVVVVALGFPGGEDQGAALAIEVQWAAFVVAGGPDHRRRGDEALSLAEAIYATVLQAPWGDGRVTRANARSLYNSATDRLGVALWSVTWQQGFDVEHVEALQDFRRLHAEWVAAGDHDRVAAVDDIELEQAEEQEQP